MAVIDISQKLGMTDKSTVKIDEEYEFEVDCGAETMLLAEQKFREAKGVEDLYNLLVLFLKEEAVKIIKEKNYKVSQLNMIVVAIMAQVNEVSYEEMEKRFRELIG